MGTRESSVSEVVSRIIETLSDSWIVSIYKNIVLPLRTRAYSLGDPSPNAAVEIQHTLLGVELKIGKRRLQSPDLSTARYLSIFARIGCSQVAVPYDITKISRLADEIESSWQRTLLLVDHIASERSVPFRKRVQKALIDQARKEIMDLGAGPNVPTFNQNTKQRR
jgi:hypothetical protein